MPHRRRLTLTQLLIAAAIKSLAITAGGACFVMSSAGPGGALVEHRAPDSSVVVSEPVPSRESRLMKRYDCSTMGFGHDATPQTAIVRDRHGRVHVVTFEEGWEVYTSGSTDDTLVAVCLHP